MALQILIKPISMWIGAETKSPGNSQFKQTYSNTRKILEFELEKLKAIESSIRLEMFIRDEDLRRDGTMLRAHVKPYKPGVVLSFAVVTKRLRDPHTNEIRNVTKTLSYPCDTYNDWRDNVRAIALSLEKLRSVARYGVFKYEDIVARLALPSAEGKISTKQAALEFLAHQTRYSVEEISRGGENSIKQAWRIAAHNLHPDKNDGKTTDEFIKLQEAKIILGI